MPYLSLRAYVIVIAVVSSLGMVLPVYAQPGPITGFSFLRLESSARAAALGGAYSAVYGDDVNSLFYNPALLDERLHRAFSVSYLNYLSDINAGFVAYAREVGGVGTLGAGIRFLNWGEIQGADETGESTGTFGASDLALTLGVGRAYSERISYGLNTHLIYSDVESYNAVAVAADLGVLYHLAEQRLAVSASLNNLGITLNSLGTREDELPLDVQVGVSKRLRYVPLLISVTGYNLHDIGNEPEEAQVVDRIMQHLALGGEFQFSDAFQVRFGYNHRTHEGMKMKSRLDMSGVGVGFGIKLSRVNVDYAYNSWSSAGGLHHFTVRTKL